MVCSKKLRSSLAFSSGELSLKLQACFYLVCISNLSTLKSASKWPLAIQSGTVTPWNSRIYIFCNMQSLPFCLYSQTGLFQIPKFSNMAKCLLICKKSFGKKGLGTSFATIFLLPQYRVGMQIDFFLGIRRRIRVQPHTEN